MWKAGDEHRVKLGISEPPKHTKGIYSCSCGPELSNCSKKLTPKKSDVSGILQKVDTMQLEDKDGDEIDTEPMTQGDRLNQIKAQRRQRTTRQLAT